MKATTFVYDGLSRLRLRGEYQGDGSQWVLQNVTGYVYDGRRVIQERDANNWPQVSYTRGNDLSGTLEGAGGIGGLPARSHGFTECSTTLTYCLTNNSGYCIYNMNVGNEYLDVGETGSYSWPAVAGGWYTVFGDSCDYYYIQVYWDGFNGTLDTRTVDFQGEGDGHVWESGVPLCDGNNSGIWLTHNYYHADGNGNVTYLVTSLETEAASYRYDAFGNTISQSGGLAEANVYRFSSKEFHAASGTYYYGFRFYSPHLQRWPNRDPLGEAGGINLYAYVMNSPINHVDPYGLAIGDWWDARTWFNSGFTESWSDSANSIGQALGGLLAWDWDQIEDAYDSGIFGQTQDAGPVPYYGTRAAVCVATAATAAAAAVGTYEFVALGNQSIMVEGVLGGGRMGSGGLFQLRVPGQPPIIRFDFHPFPGSGGRPLPHVDSPPLGWHHWPWQ